MAITSQDGHPLFCCSIASTKHIKKNIFTDEIKCSITLAEIEFYIEILLPAYRFTLLHQRTAANIAEVVPTLQMLIKKYEQFAVDTKKRPFSEALIKHIKVKFEYEFESNIYAVAAYLTQLNYMIGVVDHLQSSYYLKLKHLCKK